MNGGILMAHSTVAQLCPSKCASDPTTHSVATWPCRRESCKYSIASCPSWVWRLSGWRSIKLNLRVLRRLLFSIRVSCAIQLSRKLFEWRPKSNSERSNSERKLTPSKLIPVWNLPRLDWVLLLTIVETRQYYKSKAFIQIETQINHKITILWLLFLHHMASIIISNFHSQMFASSSVAERSICFERKPTLVSMITVDKSTRTKTDALHNSSFDYPPCALSASSAWIICFTLGWLMTSRSRTSRRSS